MANGKYTAEAEFLTALGHPIRLKILEFLTGGSRCTCEIEPEMNLDQSTISRHLIILKKAGILTSRKDGVRVIYEIKDERVLEILKLVSELILERAKERLVILETGGGV